MAHLFEPIRIKNIIVKNRIILSPMCQYRALDGFANDWHLVHYGSRAVGGAGLIFLEAVAVCSEGRITPSDLGLWKDEHISFLKRINHFIEQHGSLPGIQLAHAGRKAGHSRPWEGGRKLTLEEGGWQSIAPSPIAFKKGDAVPKEMTIDEIKQCIQYFKEAALRAKKADFKVIEIHAAHGYLINEFLSPVSNKRTDEYGGSFQNRIRFLLEIIAEIREVWTEENPLFVRISATEWQEGAWSISDSIQLASILKNKSIDLIDCSSGGNVADAVIPVKPLFQVELAEQIKIATKIYTGAVGLVTTAEQANSIIVENKADVVFIGRELLRDPYFPLRAAHTLGIEVKWPLPYERAKNY